MVSRSGVVMASLAGVILASHASVPKADAQGQTAGGEAAAILAGAREALGGDKRNAAVKTLVASGQTRQLQGDNLVPIEFEINIEWPDKYVRTDEIPARESGPNRRGFNGDTLIAGDAPGGPVRRGGPPPAVGASPAPGGKPEEGGKPAASAESLSAPTLPVKQDLARLTLGMFAASFDAYPLTFGSAGQAEAPEGRADVLDVKGDGGFSARFFIDSRTHLPLMLSWTTPPELVPVVAGQKPPANLAPGSVTFEAPAPPSASATPEEKKAFEDAAIAARTKAMAAARPVENRLYYADYREVDGLKLPFRIRRAVGATTVEETTFDRYRVNSKIDPRRFEIRK